MSELNKLLYHEWLGEITQEGIERSAGRKIFCEWRDQFVSGLCAYIRLYSDAKRYRVNLPPPDPSMNWCNAAVHIFVHAPEDIQDRFLRASRDDKDSMIAAVLKDGGIDDLSEHFHELPVIA